MGRMHRWAGALLGSAVALTIACEGSEPTPASPATSPSATAAPEPAARPVVSQAQAAEIFATRCTTCHGAEGAGDGPGSAALRPPPRDFRDPAWQASVSDEHIEQIIRFGGAAVGKSPAMPGNPDLTSKPEVVAELRVYVRGLSN